MGFGGIWSFIIGAQVACTLLFVPPRGIFTKQPPTPVEAGAFPTERYLHLPPQDGQRGAAGERGVPDDGQIGARRAGIRKTRGPIA